MTLADGGRCRWKIENQGFNIQKNAGYGLEHIFSHNTNAQKNFYLLLQIAHIINQLVEHGSLLAKFYQGKLPSLKTITLDFISEIKQLCFPWPCLKYRSCSGFQIRLDSG